MITTESFFSSLFNGEDVKTFFYSKAPKDGFHPYGQNLRLMSVKSVSITGAHDEYFLPNLSRGVAPGEKGIADKTIFKYHSVFLDFDEGQPLPEKWHVPPSAIIRREDGKGWHVYFFIHPTDNIKLWRQAQKKLIDYYHSDEAVSNPARWMRVPGSTRYKQEQDATNPPMKYEIIKCDNVRYSLEELAASLPAPQRDQDRAWLSDSPENLLNMAVETIKKAPQGERNSTLNLWAGRVFQKFPEDKRDEPTRLLTNAALEAGLYSGEISSTLNSAKQYAEKNEGEKRGRPKKSLAALELLNKYALCRSGRGRYLIIDNQAVQIGGEAYKDFAQGEFYRKTGDTLASSLLDEVGRVHRAQAGASGERQVYIRSAAPSGERSYIDLNDGKNTIIEVDADGWRTVQNPPVLFRRPANMGALPAPLLDGSVESLRRVFNLERQEDFTVIVAVMAFILRGCPSEHGTFPIIIARGREGSAKTTFMKIFKNLIDPGSPPTRTPTNDIRDLFIGANNGLVYSLDNVSFVSHDISDALSSIASGGGYARKMNYTDDEETIFDIRRPILLNGISFDIAPDLLSRSILIELQPPETYKTEEDLWKTVGDIRASALGGLLTMISAAMRHEQDIKNDQSKKITPDNQTRLADFRIFSLALERGAGWEEGKIVSSIITDQKGALEEKAAEDPLVQAIVEIVSGCGVWTGSASKLFAEVKERNFLAAPKSAATLGRLLKRYGKVFESQGIKVEQDRKNSARRWELSTIDRKPAKRMRVGI